MRIIIQEHREALTPKIVIACRWVRMDVGEKGKPGYRKGHPSNELAATSIGPRGGEKDIIRMKIQDMMPENLKEFCQRSVKTLSGMVAKRTQIGEDVKIDRFESVDTFENFAGSLTWNKHFNIKEVIQNGQEEQKEKE